MCFFVASHNSVRVRLAKSPARAIALGFGSVIVIGTLLLMLPLSSAAGKWTGVVEALFTSTSAVCVTGLVVVDTAVYWSPFGKIVILLLIQLGGLGIMLFAALVGLALARNALDREHHLLVEPAEAAELHFRATYPARIPSGTAA